jgi:hypothetical protein
MAVVTRKALKRTNMANRRRVEHLRLALHHRPHAAATIFVHGRKYSLAADAGYAIDQR